MTVPASGSMSIPLTKFTGFSMMLFVTSQFLWFFTNATAQRYGFRIVLASTRTFCETVPPSHWLMSVPTESPIAFSSRFPVMVTPFTLPTSIWMPNSVTALLPLKVPTRCRL